MLYIGILIYFVFILPLELTITYAIGCFLTAKIVQHTAAEITNTEVKKITGKFAVGAAISSIFFGLALLNREHLWHFNPVYIGIFMTIGFIILGISFGGIVAKYIFQRIEETSTSTSQKQGDS